MFKLSDTLNKAEYTEHIGQVVKLGRREVMVITYTREGRSGSYERGLKFTSTGYAGLYDAEKKQASFDHGKTWHKVWLGFGAKELRNYDFYDAWKLTPYTDRIRISTNSRKELSFDSIQEINKKYFGPGYKWKP